MYDGFYGWSLENINAGKVETKYTVEYINDKKTWDRFLKTEDIELFYKREYDNIAEALTFYLIWYVNENCFSIKLWEQIYVNGEMVLEQIIEPNGSMNYYLRTSIDREMNDRTQKAEQRLVEIEKSNKVYHDFIHRMGKHFEEMFNEYVRQVEG